MRLERGGGDGVEGGLEFAEEREMVEAVGHEVGYLFILRPILT